MKKRLEADLMSIAHKILQIKDKSDVTVLFFETRKLYEKLAVLRFVEEHFGDAKPTIGQAEVEEKMKHFFEEYDVFEFPSSTVIPEIISEEISIEQEELEELENNIDEVEEPTAIEFEPSFEIEEEQEELDDLENSIEETEELNAIEFEPSFEIEEEQEEETEEEISNTVEEHQISFLDLLSSDYLETTFVKLDQNEETPPAIAFDMDEELDIEEEEIIEVPDLKIISLNEKLAKGIQIDLNDKIAFVKHLFGNSDEDYNRVLNQLITYDSFEEAQSFIEDMVKPDYNSWEGKEDYEQRFIEIIEKKFA